MSGPAAVIDTLTELFTRHPLHEPMAGALMRAMHAAGRTGEALEIYTRIRARLVEQLGVDPSAPLQRVHRDVLRRDTDPPPARGLPRVPVVRTPAEAGSGSPVCARPVLFGRDEQLATLHRLAEAARIGRGCVVLVQGMAGMGKASLLEAWAAAERAEGCGWRGRPVRRRSRISRSRSPGSCWSLSPSRRTRQGIIAEQQKVAERRAELKHRKLDTEVRRPADAERYL